LTVLECVECDYLIILVAGSEDPVIAPPFDAVAISVNEIFGDGDEDPAAREQLDPEARRVEAGRAARARGGGARFAVDDEVKDTRAEVTGTPRLKPRFQVVSVAG